MLRILAVAAAMLLVSCIEGREEVWLNEDGSGRADVRYSLPAAAARFQGGVDGIRKVLGEFLAKAPGIRDTSHEVIREGDRLVIHVRAAFDSVREVKKSASSKSMRSLPSSAKGLAGDVKVSMEGRTIGFSRTISAGDALPGINFMPGSPMKDRNLTYILHLPVAAAESNAMRVENGGKTLIWDYPLAQAVQGPVTTRFKVKVPIPGWLWGIAAGGVATLGAASLFVARRVRKKAPVS
ncbi:MAG: nuclear transport factor 2 family protein [Verrucomicrobiaceae bacterium]|nr:MAG: nuclear transport factor 2 family protein [Verrucomicrobiaceae bacterium]